MEGEPRFDPDTFIGLMNKLGVEYVLIGRRALMHHGANVGTQDYDFFISHERKSLAALMAICDKLGFEIAPFGADDPAKSYKLSLYAGGEKVDIFRAKAYSMKDGGSVSFAEIWKSRETVDLGNGVTVNIPGLECLEKTKRIRLSPKDVEDIKYIRRLMARRMKDSRPERN